MSGRGHVGSNLCGDIDRKITFLCPLRYVFEASMHFKLEGLLQGLLSGKTQ